MRGSRLFTKRFPPRRNRISLAGEDVVGVGVVVAVLMVQAILTILHEIATGIS
jgi:hypothetical protein